MDLLATKTRAEREDDEAERLIRPSPKAKPPRHDLRREQMKPDQDPDEDDVSAKKDRSQNYKNIGGSVTGRVLYRFLTAYAQEERVRAVNEEGTIVSISPDTLKKEPGKYKKVEEEEEPAKAEGKGSPQEAGDSLRQMMKSDPALKSKLKGLMTKGEQLNGFARENPEFPVAKFFKDTPLPEGVKTLKDLQDALMTEPAKAPKSKRPPRPEPEKDQQLAGPKPEPEKYPELEDLTEEAVEEPETPPVPPKVKKPKPKVKKPRPEAPKPKPEPEAPKAEAKPEPEAPKPEAPKPEPEAPKAEEAPKPEAPKAEEAPKPEAPKAEAKPAEGAPVESDKEKAAREDLEAAKKVVERFKAKGGASKPEFQKHLDDIPTSETDPKTNEVLVFDPKSKERMPFDQLPPQRQKDLIESYETQEKTRAEEELKAGEPKRILKEGESANRSFAKVTSSKAKNLLAQLSDPESPAAKKLAEIEAEHDLEFVRPDKIFPELKGALPEEFKSLGDVAKASKAIQAYDSLSESKQRGIPEPKRREAFEAEKQAAMAEVMDTFPPEVAAKILGKGLHPDDTRELIRQYHTAKSQRPKNLSEYIDQAKSFYEEDPDRVKPPKTVTQDGESVEFKKLPRSKQAEVMRQHQMQVLGASFAAKERLTYELSMPGWTNQPRVPPEVAANMASAVLRGSDEDDSAVKKMAADTFTSTLGGGKYTPIKDSVASKLMSTIKGGAKSIAQAFLQANDYHEAKERFLSKPKVARDEFGKETVISEWDSPGKIAKGLQKASEFFDDKADLYGVPVHEAATTFRTRVLSKLKTLAPDKFAVTQIEVAKLDADDYDRAVKKYESLVKKGKKPPKPVKPVNYTLARKEKGEGGRSLFENLSLQAKVASRYANSSYPIGITMGTPLSRQAVYHGIDPNGIAMSVYRKWSQPHQRDVGEPDYQSILAQAQDWLKAPVLSMGVDGILRDTQLRAALDLAVETTNYKIDPNTYNTLLARLGGKSVSGSAPTRSSYEGTSGEVTTMKASVELRKLATKVSSENPKLAYEVMSLATRLAADEDEKKQAEGQQEQKQAANNHPDDCTCPICKNTKKEAAEQQAEAKDDEEQKKQAAKYASLRSAVIRTAASDANAKQALLPVLQVIKTLG
jgi:hypothetical protein